jgi:hypothetical protein
MFKGGFQFGHEVAGQVCIRHAAALLILPLTGMRSAGSPDYYQMYHQITIIDPAHGVETLAPVMLEAFMASDSGFRKARRQSGLAC